MIDSVKTVVIPDGLEAEPVTCWCHRGAWTLTFRARGFNLLRCSSCGSYSISPPPLTSREDGHEFYTDYYLAKPRGDAAIRDLAHRGSRFWRVARQYLPLLEPQSRVVDVGCGDGHLCGQLHQAGWESVIGLDISTTRILRARQIYPHLTFFDRSLAEVELVRDSVDLVVLDSVIEHLPDPAPLLADIYACLRPGGRFVVITPNMASGNFRLLGKRWTPLLAPSAHVLLYTPDSLAALLRERGFHVEKIGAFHLPAFGLRRFWHLLIERQVKRLVWHIMLELGAVYAWVTRAGPMLYAVVQKS